MYHESSASHRAARHTSGDHRARYHDYPTSRRRADYRSWSEWKLKLGSEWKLKLGSEWKLKSESEWKLKSGPASGWELDPTAWGSPRWPASRRSCRRCRRSRWNRPPDWTG